MLSLQRHSQKQGSPWQVECACGRGQPAGSEAAETSFKLRHREENLEFCVGSVVGVCVVSMLTFDE